MKFLPLIGTSLSGSVGGLTASRNRGGAYFKEKPLPVNPNTAQQVEVRNSMRNALYTYRNDLTDAQLAAWAVYAENTPVTDKIGQTTLNSALNMFVRANVPRKQIGLQAVKDAPTIYDLGSFKEVQVQAATIATLGMIVNVPGNSTWNEQDDSALSLYVSRPYNATKTSFNGSYQFAGILEGESATPPSQKNFQNVPFSGTWVTGNRVFWKVNISWGDGRYSNAQVGDSIIV